MGDSTRLRVLLVSIAIEGGGAEQVVRDLAEGLAATQHEVTLAFLEGSDVPLAHLEAAGIRCVRLLDRREFADSALADFTPSCIFHLRRLIREFSPDLVHAHVPRPTLWTAAAKRFFSLGVPLVYTEHNMQDAYGTLGRLLYRFFLPATDHVVCISTAARLSFLAGWGWDGGRVTTIWNGISASRVRSTADPDETRKALGVSPEAWVVCNVGHLTTRKAQEVLVEAMARVHAQLPSAHCWIVGRPEIEPTTARAVRQTVDTCDAHTYVSLLGHRRDIAGLLAASDIFVLSSRQEGFPITILEAMAGGKPVVATDVGGCAEAVVHRETGLIVPPEDPQALAEALQYLLEHPDEARAMGEAGHRRVEEHFTVETMVRRHIEVYAEVRANAGRD